MPSSNGTPSRGTLTLSAAARYRELRVNRAVYVLGVLVLLAPWALWLVQFQSVLSTPGPTLAAMHTTLAHLVRQNLQLFAQGSTGFATFDVFVAAALGIAVVGYDRMAGGLFYSLEGPLRRREVWLAKAFFGASAIVLVVALGTAAILLAAALSGNLDLTGPILLRALFDATGQLSLFATALAMGGAMGTVFSCLATGTWAGLPALVSGLVATVFVGPYVEQLNGQPVTVLVTDQWAWHLSQTLHNISPFQPGEFSQWPLYAFFALIALFVAWTALMAWLGPLWWDRAPFERLHDGVFFPALWNFYYAFLSLGSGLILTTLITGGATIKGLGWAAIYAAVFVASWFFWRFVVTRRGRRAVWRQGAGAQI